MSRSINRAEVIARISQECMTDKETVTDALKVFESEIIKSIAAERKVIFKNFGSFRRTNRKAGRNNLTGRAGADQEMLIRFKPSRKLVKIHE